MCSGGGGGGGNDVLKNFSPKIKPHLYVNRKPNAKS